MAKLSIRSVSKSYGAVKVLDDISIEVDHGKLVVLLGPSGCGKSTLLHAIAGLHPIDSGEILISERNVTTLPARERDVAMVFQSYALYPTMSVAENIGFPLRMRGVGRSTAMQQVGEVARLLKIESLLDRRPRDLSGGQRQRVAIGRALVRNPALFLFDEPLSNLDAALRTDLRAEIKRLHRSIRGTMIYVTHDQVEALTLAEIVVLLRQGKIEQVGSPLSLYHDPESTFVATFIGTPRMNIFKAIASEEGILIDGGATIRPRDLRSKLRAGQNVLVGIRPEHFGVEGEGRLLMTVDVVEQLGSTSYVYGTLSTGERIVVEERQKAPQFGDKVQVHISVDNVLLFDSNGNRLR